MPYRRAFTVAILVVGVALLLRFWSPFPVFQQGARFLTDPPLLLTHYLTRGFGGITHSVLTLAQAQKVNQEQSGEINSLKSRILFYEGIEKENQDLRRTLGFQARPFVHQRLMGVEVLARHPETWFSNVEINKGERHGVRSGMVALSPEGVVGFVTRSFPLTSTVQLITDPQMVIPSVCERTREVGLLAGQGDNSLQLRLLPSDAEVKPGDLVMTSGASERFPEGLRLGYVTEVQDDPDHFFKKVAVRPTANLGALHTLFLIATP